MPILSKKVHDMWLHEAAKSNPPEPADVAQMQYGLSLPWHVRKKFLVIVKRIRKGGPIHKYMLGVTRGGGKSVATSFLVLYVAEYVLPFMDIRPSNRRILVIGRRQEYVIDVNMKEIGQAICVYSPWLKTLDSDLWNDAGALEAKRYNSWSKTRFDLTNGVSIRGYGIDQSVRGEHVYLVVIDDVVDDKNFNLVKHQMNILKSAVEPATEAGGAIVVTGTLQTNSDLYSKLTEEDGWEVVWLPAWDDNRSRDYEAQNRADVASGRQKAETFQHPEDWHCLWPERVGYEYLMSLRGKTRASIRSWLRERQLQTIDDDTMLVHPNDLAAAKDPSLTFIQSVEQGECYAGIDPSSLSEDPAGLVVLLKREDGTYQLAHSEEIPKLERTVDDHDKAREALDRIFTRIESIHRRFKPKWLVESNGMQGVILPLAEDRIPGIEMDTHFLSGKKHSEEGWPRIRTVMEAGKLKLPTGPRPGEEEIPEEDWDSVSKTEALIEQIKGLQYVDGKVEEDKTVKNDLVSALYLALRVAESGHEVSEAAAYTIGRVAPGEPRKLKGAEFGTPRSSSPLDRARSMSSRRHALFK